MSGGVRPYPEANLSVNALISRSYSSTHGSMWPPRNKTDPDSPTRKPPTISDPPNPLLSVSNEAQKTLDSSKDEDVEDENPVPQKRKVELISRLKAKFNTTRASVNKAIYRVGLVRSKRSSLSSCAEPLIGNTTLEGMRRISAARRSLSSTPTTRPLDLAMGTSQTTTTRPLDPIRTLREPVINPDMKIAASMGHPWYQAHRPREMQVQPAADPQFFYVVPRYLHLTKSWKSEIRHKPLNPNGRIFECFLYYLHLLTDIPEDENGRIINLPMGPLMASKCLDALRYVGLDMRDGIQGVIEGRQLGLSEGQGFLMLGVQILDEYRARIFVDVGPKVDRITMMIRTPETFEEALSDWSLLTEYIGIASMGSLKLALSLAKSESQRWMLKRLIFRAELMDRTRAKIVEHAALEKDREKGAEHMVTNTSVQPTEQGNRYQELDKRTSARSSNDGSEMLSMLEALMSTEPVDPRPFL
ncbi:hypothetical protein B0J11DRAFT_511519 [Dendryphion nanum]|uniref:Uncharacterized protein n=1 Tax=Dendryphion nanum TaxID=256645 RepID=A0A9P9D6I2_9PLEO|nr:hypothetical protein B0J11DRAFT_511519 [Dendryphion nanum]